jgi:DNA polymerase-3 subunit alpha
MSDTDKIVKYVKDAQSHKIEVVPPHINHSEYKFSVKGDKILFSLGAIKGVGEAAVQAIVEARMKRPEKKFANLEEFFGEVDLKKVNKKTIEALIKAGAMDGFGYNRNEILSGFHQFVERAEGARQDREVGQTSLFDLDQEAQENNLVKLERMEDWTRPLSLAYEKEVLGFYLTDHPLRGLEVLGKILGAVEVRQLIQVNHKSKVHILCLVSSYREIITKKGTRMAFARAEDTTGGVELVVFPDTFAQYERVLKSDAAVVISGVVEKAEGAAKVIAEQIKPAEELVRLVKKVTLKLDSTMASKLALIRQWAEKNPGDVPLVLRLALPELGKTVDMDVNELGGVKPTLEALDSLNRLGIPVGLN